MNIDLNCFDDAKLGTLFYTAKSFSDYFQKKSAFSLFLAQTCSNSLYVKIVLKSRKYLCILIIIANFASQFS